MLLVDIGDPGTGRRGDEGFIGEANSLMLFVRLRPKDFLDTGEECTGEREITMW